MVSIAEAFRNDGLYGQDRITTNPRNRRGWFGQNAGKEASEFKLQLLDRLRPELDLKG